MEQMISVAGNICQRVAPAPPSGGYRRERFDRRRTVLRTGEHDYRGALDTPENLRNTARGRVTAHGGGVQQASQLVPAWPIPAFTGPVGRSHATTRFSKG